MRKNREGEMKQNDKNFIKQGNFSNNNSKSISNINNTTNKAIPIINKKKFKKLSKEDEKYLSDIKYNLNFDQIMNMNISNKLNNILQDKNEKENTNVKKKTSRSIFLQNRAKSGT